MLRNDVEPVDGSSSPDARSSEAMAAADDALDGCRGTESPRAGSRASLGASQPGKDSGQFLRRLQGLRGSDEILTRGDEAHGQHLTAICPRLQAHFR